MKTLFCPNCSWRLEGEIGIKPECPDCKNHLNLLTGTKEEIENYINQKYPKFKKKKLCPACGGI